MGNSQDQHKENRKMIKEVTTLARLSHARIVRYYNSWIEGQDVEEVVAADGAAAARRRSDQDEFFGDSSKWGAGTNKTGHSLKIVCVYLTLCIALRLVIYHTHTYTYTHKHPRTHTNTHAHTHTHTHNYVSLFISFRHSLSSPSIFFWLPFAQQ